MKIAIVSGKGGTGKTTVAVNLALADSRIAWLADCDVEAPNAELFLEVLDAERATVFSKVPEIDAERCLGCGACARLCQFKALVQFGGRPLTFPSLCHACGGCARVCPTGAIHWAQQPLGEIHAGRVERPGAAELRLIAGRLEVGKPLAPPLIQQVHARLPGGGIGLVDGPPGTSCAMVAAVRPCDYALLVTEPTPFGLHDLKLAVEVVRQLQLPFGVVVNRSDPADRTVEAYCAGNAIELLAQIPDDRRVAEAYSAGIPAVRALPEFAQRFRDLFEVVLNASGGCRDEVCHA